MSYSVKIEHFEGPLDLLLQLIESEKLEITTVSLMQVTEPFVQHVRENQGNIPPEELADFLVVAAKLVYLKSRAILPGLTDVELDEGPDLESQLRLYKAFVAIADQFDVTWKSGACSFSRTRHPVREMVGFVPPRNVTTALLQELYQKIVKRLEPIAQLPKAAILRAISIEEKIEELRERIRRSLKTSFHRFLAEAQDRSEMVVSFLALLELIKQRIVSVNQGQLFEDIHLEKL
ncbi:MAG: segregation/condensation protein A [bacterium]|nr:segregation/condensation protein A [bacterium]